MKPSSSPASAPAETKALRIEVAISNLLRAGVAGSFALVTLGTVLCFLHDEAYRNGAASTRAMTSPGAAFPRTAAWLVHGLASLDGRAFIVAGLLLLILTPVLRVAVSILAFALERDWRYVAITTFVLALLILSFALGRAV